MACEKNFCFRIIDFRVIAIHFPHFQLNELFLKSQRVGIPAKKTGRKGWRRSYPFYPDPAR
jgi:hypothetical protein